MAQNIAKPRGSARSTPVDGRSPAPWLLGMLVNMRGLWAAAGLMLGSLMAGIILVTTLTPPIYPTFGVSYMDKVYHFGAFALLVFPIILTEPRRWVWAVPVCIGFGGAIELAQPSFGRSAEWLDFGADVSGVLAGAALAEVLHDHIRAWAANLRGDRVEETPEIDEHALREKMREELRAELRETLHQELAKSPMGSLSSAQSGTAPPRRRSLKDPVPWPQATPRDVASTPTAFGGQSLRH
jgi:hypothetical protein